jgi:hypothetical protein
VKKAQSFKTSNYGKLKKKGSPGSTNGALHCQKTEEERVPDAKTAIRFFPSPQPCAVAVCRARARKRGRQLRKRKAPHPRSPQPKQLKSRERRREEKVGWGIGSDQSEKAKLACFLYRIPPISRPPSVSRRGDSAPRRRWTSSSISSSARPGESCPSPCPAAVIRVLWVWIWAASARGFSGGGGWAVGAAASLWPSWPGLVRALSGRQWDRIPGWQAVRGLCCAPRRAI